MLKLSTSIARWGFGTYNPPAVWSSWVSPVITLWCSSVCNYSPLFPLWHFCLSVMPESSFLPGQPPAYHNLVRVGVCPFLFQSQFISPEGFLLRVQSVKDWQQTNDSKILSCLFRLSRFRCFPSTAWDQKSLFPSPTFVQSVSNAWDGNNLVAHPSLLWDQM